MSLHIEMPLDYEREKGYETNIEFADSLMVNNVKFSDVYYIESDGLLYYLQEGKGLVAFEFDDDFWMLSDNTYNDSSSGPSNAQRTCTPP